MFNQNLEIIGLETVNTTVPDAGPYFVKGKLQLPRVAAGGGQSSAIVTITNRTGPVTLFTGDAGADGFYINTLCAAGDIIRVAITSAADADQDVNALKTQFQIGSGQ